MGLPTSILLRWTGIANADAVMYEVYASTVAGFTADSATLVGEIDGTQFAVRQLTDGTPLQQDQIYYFATKAKDVDGSASKSAEGSGMLAKITGPDIAANSIIGIHIAGESIDAEHISSVVTLSSMFRTAESGRRSEISNLGFFGFDQAGNPIIGFPNDPTQQPFIRAVLEALGLTVTGNATFRGSENVLDSGAAIIMRNRVADPATAPSLVQSVPTATIVAGGGSSTDAAYPWFDGTNIYLTRFQDESQPEVVKFDATMATEVAAVEPPMPSLTTWHYVFVVKVGSYWYGLAKRGSDGDRRWIVWDSTGTGGLPGALTAHGGYFQDENDLGASSEVSLTTDGTKLYTLQEDATSDNGKLKVFTPPGTGAVPTHDGAGSHVTIGQQFWNSTKLPVPFIRSNADFGSTRYIFRARYGSLSIFGVTDTAGVWQTNELFPAAEGTPSRGFWYNSGFKELKSNETAIWAYTGWVWTTESALYWVRYTWSDNTGESARSPVSSITMFRRWQLTITSPDFPGGISEIRVYMDRGAAEPTLDWQVDSATKSVVRSSFTAGGAAPPTVATLPSSTPAIIRSDDSTVVLDADGRITMPGITRVGKRIQLMDDFTASPTAGGAVGVADFIAGAGATVLQDVSAIGHPGVWQCGSGTTSTGRAGIQTAADLVRIGDGIVRAAWLLRLGTNLSDGTNRYRVIAGFSDTIDFTTINDGIWFHYVDTQNSGAWEARKVLSGVTSVIDPLDDNGGLHTVVASQWVLLEIEVDDDGSVGRFYINKVLKGQFVTPLPSALMRAACWIQKLVGGANREIRLDAWEYEQEILTARY
jgi:hypothetical protein